MPDNNYLAAYDLRPNRYPHYSLVAGKYCPITHFNCLSHGSHLCLPIYLRCNHVQDCPGHGDEVNCDDYQCPGYYRCRHSRICVHAKHVCDGNYGQCPQNDDELLCGFTCPPGCQCFGMAFFCNQSVPAGQYPELRYLSAEGSNMTLKDVENNTMLIYLSLARCFLKDVQAPYLVNLCSLDLRDNHLTSLRPDSLELIKSLRVLILGSNPLNVQLSAAAVSVLSNLRVLDVSRTAIRQFDPSGLGNLISLRTLNLSYSGLFHVLGDGFQRFKSLQTIDLLGCSIAKFPQSIFANLHKLQFVTADNYKMCCALILPRGFNPSGCKAPIDLVSSCEDLLRTNVYRVALSLIAALSLSGNVTSLLYRTLFDKRTRSSGFGVFVIQLCASDFLMGVYLTIVGIADRLYKGTYLWNDFIWKQSRGCSLAGFLSLFSSEVSAFLIFIITVDRFLVLRFPFSHFHFTPRTAHITCFVAWAVGSTLAIIPLMPMMSHWQFYGQTGICSPLPVTKNDFEGYDYSFGVLIGLNSVLFLFTAAGQGFIYWTVSSNTISRTYSSGTSKDLTIASRLITVVVSDFMCWFPIGLLGILTADGFHVPEEVNVAMAILVMPLNSALNPFLYTVNIILEQRRKVREQHLLSILAEFQDRSKNKHTVEPSH